MVGVKRKAMEVIAESGPVSSSNSLNSTSIDRRTKAIRSCSNWNSALLHGRRTRGPQWDYATASYHVSKGSAEYFKGVTRIQSDPLKMNAAQIHHVAAPNTSQFLITNTNMRSNVPGLMNPSLPTNVYPLSASSQFPIHTMKNHPTAPMNAAAGTNSHLYGLAQQLPANLQSRVTLNVPMPNVQPSHAHGFPVVQDADHQFPTRLRPTLSQHSHQSSGHGHAMGNTSNPANGYSSVVHPTHMHLVGNPLGSTNAPVESKPSSGMLSNQIVNPSQPHFQAGLPPGGGGVYGMARHMSTTPSPAQFYNSN